MTNQTYDLKGMHCASCAQTVETTLHSLEGIHNAVVNLALEQVTIDYDKEKTSYKEIQKVLSDKGYNLMNPKETLDLSKNYHDYKISGMSCASCAQTIETAVSQLEPVKHASINLTTETLTVHWQDHFQSQIIEDTVHETGYEAELILNPQEQFKQRMQDKAQEQDKARKHLWVMILLAIPLFIIAMGPMMGISFPSWIHPQSAPLTFTALQWVLASALMWLSRDIFQRGFRTLLSGHPNMDSLVAVGTGAAYLQGLVTFINLLMQPDHHMGHHIPLYFESAGVILTLITLGNYLENMAKGKTSKAIQSLMELTPDNATLIKDGKQVQVPVSTIEPGDYIQVKPGERVPLDGIIIQGTSSVDESMLTGESLPVDKTSGDTVTGGSFNNTGTFTFEVQAVGSDTMLSKIITMVQDAQGAKAPIARLADQISRYFVPTVIVIAVLASLFWFFIMGKPLDFALNIFISVLIIACPCALGLATPTAMMVGIGNGAQKGILIKSGPALESLHNADTILFDKTGTITHGQPQVMHFQVADSFDSQALLSKIVAAEKLSQHPLAQAIVTYGQDQTDNDIQVDSFDSVTGQGIVAHFSQDILYIGKQDYIDSIVGLPQAVIDTANTYAKEGLSPIFIAENQEFAGLIIVGDQIKENSPVAISQLHDQEIQVMMVTGDHQQTAQAIADKVQIDKVYSNVLPQDKTQVVKDLQAQGHHVIMVGDGINDAPALAQANIGLAIGSGSDIAIESADVVLMHDDLSDVSNSIRLSRATIRNIKQNLFWAFIYNIIGIPFAMGMFYLFGGPLLNPMIAAAAMSFSSISVLLNSLRLRFFK